MLILTIYFCHSKVYVDPLSREDYIYIAGRMFPGFQEELITRMVDFNSQVNAQTFVL